MTLPRLLGGINHSCDYVGKCHKDLEDCTFCFCPLYPCEDKEKGTWLHVSEKKIWDCSKCTWIHQTKVAEEIYDIIKNNY